MDTLSRIEIIKFFSKRCGVSYRKAAIMYSALNDLFDEAIKNKDSIRIGKIGIFKPIISNPKRVVKGFIRGINGEVTPASEVYNIDHRIKYRFKLFKEYRRKNRM